MLDIAGSPSFIASHAIRKRLVPTASLFHPGTLSCSLHDRYYDLPPPPPPTPTSPPSHPCVVCFECFDTPALLESHEAMHTYQCTACNKVLLTAHQLNIHITERHDPFWSAAAERAGASFCGYSCLVEDCSLAFKSDGNRKRHLIEGHAFPSWFEFHSKTVTKKLRKEARRGGAGRGGECRFFGMRGGCNKGARCRFVHEEGMRFRTTSQESPGTDESDNADDMDTMVDEGGDGGDAGGDNDVMMELAGQFESGAKVVVPKLHPGKKRR